jgi:hypothetical protein
MNGQSRPIAIDLGGELFADGAGSYQAIATLPLAPGYTTTYRNLDVQTMQSKAMQLSVVGSEEVTVPAGTFDAFKVEIAGADGTKTTLWVAKSPRQAVKAVATLPAMGGAVVTTELKK